jgi:hypothetical protein
MMKSVTTVLEDWLVAQGMHDRTVGAGKVVVNGDGGVAGKSAPRHQPAKREGGPLPIGNSGKGPRVNASAKFTGLRVIVDNSRCMPLRPTRSAERGSGIHLVFSK